MARERERYVRVSKDEIINARHIVHVKRNANRVDIELSTGKNLSVYVKEMDGEAKAEIAGLFGDAEPE